MASKDNKPSVHSGHRQRVKDRFIEGGISGFADHEVLELLLYYSVPRKDTNELAHLLIEEFGSLNGVFDAPFDALAGVKGVGANTATLIKLMPAVYSRYLESKKDNDDNKLDTNKKACEYAVSKLLCFQKETLLGIFLDVNMNVKKSAVLGNGDIDSINVDFAKIINIASNCNCKNVIIAHNHPSGVAAPSMQDADVTRELARTLFRMGFRLCDSIIVSDTDYFSMAESKKYRYLF